jgi:hypothetical protein
MAHIEEYQLLSRLSTEIDVVETTMVTFSLTYDS